MDYDKILSSDDINEIAFHLKNTKAIANTGSLSDLTTIEQKFDFLLANPPYIHNYVSKEKIIELKEKGLSNVFNNGRVNMTELSFR